MSNSSLFTPALLRTHSFVFFAVRETRRIFLSHFISKASRRVSSFFLRVPLSQPYVATGHTSAFISRIFETRSPSSHHVRPRPLAHTGVRELHFSTQSSSSAVNKYLASATETWRQTDNALFKCGHAQYYLTSRRETTIQSRIQELLVEGPGMTHKASHFTTPLFVTSLPSVSCREAVP